MGGFEFFFFVVSNECRALLIFLPSPFPPALSLSLALSCPILSPSRASSTLFSTASTWLLTGVVEREGTAEDAVPLRTEGSLDRDLDDGRERTAFVAPLPPPPFRATLRRSDASLEIREPLPERSGGRCIVQLWFWERKGGKTGRLVYFCLLLFLLRIGCVRETRLFRPSRR